MVEEGIRGGIFHSLLENVTTKNKYIKFMMKRKFFQHMFIKKNNLYENKFSNQLPVDGSQNKIPKFTKNMIKTFDDNSDNDFEVIINLS